jgi:hypothetical protein
MNVFKGFIQYIVLCSYDYFEGNRECYLVLYRKLELIDLTLLLPYTLFMVLMDILTGAYGLSWKTARRFKTIEEAVSYLIYLQSLPQEDQLSFLSLLERKII